MSVIKELITPELKEQVKQDIEKIKISLEQGLVNIPEGKMMPQPSNMDFSYAQIKGNVLAVLGLDNINEKVDDQLFPLLENLLIHTNIWVRMGKLVYEENNFDPGGVSDAYFLQKFEDQGLEPHLKEIYYVFYFVLALIEIIEFELSHSQSWGSEADYKNLETSKILYDSSIATLGCLLNAQDALAGGVPGLERARMNNQDHGLKSFTDKHLNYLKSFDGLEKSREKKKKESIKKWKPLTKDVALSVSQKGKSVSQACKDVGYKNNLSEKEINSLRTKYYTYKNNSDKNN